MVLLVLLFGFVECLCHWFAATGVSLVFGFCLDGGVWLVAGGWFLGFYALRVCPCGFWSDACVVVFAFYLCWWLHVVDVIWCLFVFVGFVDGFAVGVV